MKLKVKAVPPPTLSTVSPPNTDYSYFDEEGMKVYPFRYASNSYELANAWWLAEAALLAYADEGFVKNQYLRAGLKEVRSFIGDSTQCYVASTDRFAIVSFRGTRVLKAGSQVSLRDIVNDLITDSKFILVDSGHGGFVHEGFQEGLKQVWESNGGLQGLKPYLDLLKRGNRQQSLWLTGHSLGAALATLAAQSYGDVQGLYTFGSPLVGDEEFADSFSIKNAYRFVNNNDFVTQIPPKGIYKPFRIIWPTGAYKHVGMLKYIDSQGRILTNLGTDERLDDRLRGYRTRTEEIVKLLSESGIVGIPDDNLVDHAPVYYATHMWNNCALNA